MGWDFSYRAPGQSDREYFADRYAHLEILDCATIHHVFYAAVRRREHGPAGDEIFALVVLTQWRPQQECNFGTKSMTDSSHPYYYDCPDHILDLLTPIDPAPQCECEEGESTPRAQADAWRRKCREQNARQRTVRDQIAALRDGDLVEFDEPLRWVLPGGDTFQERTFRVCWPAERRRRHAKGGAWTWTVPRFCPRCRWGLLVRIASLETHPFRVIPPESLVPVGTKQTVLDPPLL